MESMTTEDVSLMLPKYVHKGRKQAEKRVCGE